MRSSHTLDRQRTLFDDRRLVSDAGLLLPATLAQHLGLRGLLDQHVNLGATAGRANVGAKALTLIMSALAGGDCIDDADALRAGATSGVLGHRVPAPSTLGTFLRSFSWGHARQLDRVSRETLSRAWAAGAGPGLEPLTIDLDSTICETYGLHKHGGSRFTYAHVRGYHPLLAVAADSGEVLHARLRRGPAPTVWGAASFLAETVSRVRGAGATGALTLRADSGFYARSVVTACRRANVRFSITIRSSPALRRAIEAIPAAAWTVIPYWLDGGADVAETSYTPFAERRGASPLRLIVRRQPKRANEQLAFDDLDGWRLHAIVTNVPAETMTAAEVEATTGSAAASPRTPSGPSSTTSG